LIARLASRSTKIMRADTSPSPPFRGEREGPNRRVGRVEVGGATNRFVGYPLPPASGGERGKGARRQKTLSKDCFFNFPRTALRVPGCAAVQPGRQLELDAVVRSGADWTGLMTPAA
jgi:hypothetical protein